MGLPNLDELQKKCEDLGLTVKIAGKKPAKTDYVLALRNHFMPEGGLPYEEITPMLCFAHWNLKEEEQEGIWRNPSWIAQKKLNGCRVMIHIVPGKGVFAHSRTISLATYRFQELSDHLLFADYKAAPSAYSLDCEALIEKSVDTRPYTSKGEVTQTSLHSTTSALHLEAENSKKMQREQDAPIKFKVFDVLKCGTENLCKKTLKYRLEMLEKFMKEIKGTELEKYFETEPYVQENKKEFCDKIIAEGGEGVVLKNLHSIYEDSSSRSRSGWIKVKKRMEVDAFVTGFIRGEEGSGWKNMVGALELSVFLENGKAHPIAMCSSMPMEYRVAISEYDHATNTVTMKADVYGKVAQVSGQDITPRVLRLSHATLDRWRDQAGDEKRKEDCVMSMKDLKKMSDWVG